MAHRWGSAQLLAIPVLALSLFLVGCPKRPATTAASAPAPTGAPAPSSPAPSTPSSPSMTPAPAAPPSTAAPATPPPPSEFAESANLKDVYFDFGKAEIRPVDETILDSNAAWLRAHPDYLLLIEGHCDVRGVALRKNEFNMALGERRAEAAMKYLVARGVQPDRITILSYGEERPVCGEQSERCWRQNRRSRFLVKPRSEAARTRE